MVKRKGKDPSEPKKMSFFDIMDSINKKKYLEWSEEVDSAYSSFMINRGFSNNEDSVLVANELNLFPDLDKKLQYDFYYHLLPKRARYGKWEKADGLSKAEDNIMELLSLSRRKAQETESLLKILLGDSMEKHLNELNDKGGMRK